MVIVNPVKLTMKINYHTVGAQPRVNKEVTS